MLHRALLDPVTHFFTKQSSIVSSLRPSLLVYLEQVGKASAAMVCKESCTCTCSIVADASKKRVETSK